MCTAIRFNDNKGNMFFGRNLDWTSGFGQKVVVTPRNYVYKSAFLGEMRPRHGAIIGMAVVEDNTPLYFDCANEAGLAVAGLNFPGYADYAAGAVDEKTNVAQYEFPLWVMMNFQSVDEVEEALKNTVIVAKPFNDKMQVSELHYMIADNKRAIVVEYTENGMEVFSDDVDVLTNQPGFSWHRENLKNYMNLFSLMPKAVDWGGARITPFGSGALMCGIPGDYYPSSRFVRVAYLNTHYPVKSSELENVSRLFHTLGGVAMADGAAQAADGKYEITLYTGGYSAATKTYYYNTYEELAIRDVKMADFDLDGSELIQV